MDKCDVCLGDGIAANENGWAKCSNCNGEGKIMSKKKVYFDKKTGRKVEEVARGNIPPSKVVLVQLNEVGTGSYYYATEALLNSDRFEEVEG